VNANSFHSFSVARVRRNVTHARLAILYQLPRIILSISKESTTSTVSNARGFAWATVLRLSTYGAWK
jgi:hypothetical protein